MTGLLTEAGVGVYPDDATDGVEPVRLTRWQVGNLVAEAANGGGVTGAVLSELAPVPAGVPPVSYLLAAWGPREVHALPRVRSSRTPSPGSRKP